jgi:hypothetical protein
MLSIFSSCQHSQSVVFAVASTIVIRVNVVACISVCALYSITPPTTSKQNYQQQNWRQNVLNLVAYSMKCSKVFVVLRHNVVVQYWRVTLCLLFNT